MQKHSILDVWRGSEFASAEGRCQVYKKNTRRHYVKCKSAWYAFWPILMILANVWLSQRLHSQRCFNVNLTLSQVATSYQPKDNLETKLKCLLETGSLCKVLFCPCSKTPNNCTKSSNDCWNYCYFSASPKSPYHCL